MVRVNTVLATATQEEGEGGKDLARATVLAKPNSESSTTKRRGAQDTLPKADLYWGALGGTDFACSND